MIYFSEYLNLFIYIGFCFVISFVLFLLSFFLDFFFFFNKKNIEKYSSYECGFQPFADARSKFDIRFYLVSILFIIFDLEIIYIVPWALTYIKYDYFSCIVMFVFLFILTVGFFYEWFKGALDWQ